jgi:hypothetical protein
MTAVHIEAETIWRSLVISIQSQFFQIVSDQNVDGISDCAHSRYTVRLFSFNIFNNTDGRVHILKLLVM